MTFTPERLQQQLAGLPGPRGYLLAYSGGLDSTVLLHALAALRPCLSAPLRAVHINHGLQPEAAAWTQAGAARCAALGVPYRALSVSVPQGSGESLEANARDARYRALAGQLGADEMLLTAQHADDQLETVLLQLARGAGVAGLAGMAPCQRWHQGWLARPLLAVTREELEHYAAAWRLDWCEDPSNRDPRFTRNWLRHEILPQLLARWPGLRASVGRSARHCAQAAALQDAVAADDFAADPGHRPGCLQLGALRQLPAARQSLLLRHWLQRSGLPLPDAAHTARILAEVCTARPDAAPCVRWPGAEVRRYRDTLRALPPLPPPPPATTALRWDGKAPLPLPAGLGRLELHPAPAIAPAASGPHLAIAPPAPGAVHLPSDASAPAGLRLPAGIGPGAELIIRFRVAGLRCRPAGRQGSRSFKRLAQDLGIPPWERERTPLLYLGDRLLSIADHCLCAPFAPGAGNDGWRLRWRWPGGDGGDT